MAFDPRIFNPGLVNPGMMDSLTGREGGDDFEHSWSYSQDPVQPGAPEPYQDQPWMPETDEFGARSGETPRERESQVSLRAPAAEGPMGGGDGSGGMEPNSQTTPARPRTPQPSGGAGPSTMVAQGSVPGGIRPFKPLSAPGGAKLATSRASGLYGSSGGLQGGGLGVPLDPVSNQQSNPLDMLLQLFNKIGR